MRDGSPTRQRRIQDIVAQIASLSDELQSLLLDPDQPPLVPAVVVPDPQPPPPAPVPPPEQHRSNNPNSTSFFLENDRIQVESNRNGLRGARGTVTRVNDSFVFFRLDSSDTVIWRAPRNIRRIHPPP